jgi:hypothetical protein
MDREQRSGVLLQLYPAKCQDGLTVSGRADYFAVSVSFFFLTLFISLLLYLPFFIFLVLLAFQILILG